MAGTGTQAAFRRRTRPGTIVSSPAQAVSSLGSFLWLKQAGSDHKTGHRCAQLVIIGIRRAATGVQYHVPARSYRQRANGLSEPALQPIALHGVPQRLARGIAEAAQRLVGRQCAQDQQLASIRPAATIDGGELAAATQPLCSTHAVAQESPAKRELDREPLPALSSTRLQHVSTAGGAHARPKPVGSLAGNSFRLIGTLGHTASVLLS